MSSGDERNLSTDYQVINTEIVRLWNKLLDEDRLSFEFFKGVWKWEIPKNYNIKISSGIPKVVRDDNIENAIFRPLEQFMFTRNESESFKELEKIVSNVTACGHVFRYGESTYTCRDCASDSTCVLCVDCFKFSAHRHHRYRMSSSIGGGCCDCGDIEAWKSEPWCSHHKGVAEANLITSLEEEEQDENIAPAEKENKLTLPASDERSMFAILDLLDAHLVKRIATIFSHTVRYAFDILTYYNYELIPEGLSPETTVMRELIEQGPTDPNYYCTILYNDESHTYEQVTSAVLRVTSCGQKIATDLVTQVDREGRALVKCGDFQSCFQVHEEIQGYLARFNHSPLKTLILHHVVVCHQYFALDLLAWLEALVKKNTALRLIFSKVVMQSPGSILEGVMLRDSRMWKSARMQWNLLFFYGVLVEYNTKKCFAKILTSNYGLITSNLMNDDHDHSFSIASLSVQVYTVPSLSLYLIEHEDVLYNLLNAFLSECIRSNKTAPGMPGTLVLGRNPNVHRFKRSYFVLFDLRYLLSFKPRTWNTALRRNFLHGFSIFLKVLVMMQGMEPITRCVYEHAEYEQEWESAFSLHCKIALVISLMHEWCGEDKLVLIKAYRAVLKKIDEHPLPGIDEPRKKCTVGQHSYPCLEYDVSRRSVSIHIPLTRLLAALHLHLQKYDLDFFSTELMYPNRSRIDQIMEPVFRQQVLIAQVHANMWRRNGVSLPNQLQLYANCKYRNEMLDCDIVMLQTAAAVMCPDEFIINMLNRFNLLNWAEEDYLHILKGPEDDSLRQVITLAEEFIGLLITIVGERFVPGVGCVTAEECLCHEIIQQLCIKPMTHSELNQSLHKDFNHETGLESVVDLVATLKEHPQGKKLYELRPERAAEFNLFFYHFTREERSRAEENQRKQHKLAKELECCPPPLPPAFTATYSRVTGLLHCNTVLLIMKNVLTRTASLRNSCFSELQLQEVLYLMGFALLEEEKQLKNASSLMETKRTSFSSRAEEMRILPGLLETLLKCPRGEAQGQIPLLTWTLGQYRQVLRLRSLSPEQLMEQGMDLPRAGTSAEEEQAKKTKESRTEWIAKHRARTLQQMQAMQANFMKENASFLAAVEAEMRGEEGPVMPTVEQPKSNSPPVALGPNRSPPAPLDCRFTCILCQATETIGTPEARHMVMAALVQQSTVLCRSREKSNSARQEDHDLERPLPCMAVHMPCLGSNLGPAPHVNSCGHKMHVECFHKYYENAVQKESRRSIRRLAPPFDVEKEEFMCPLCNNLSNCVLPVLPPMEVFMLRAEEETRINISFDEFINLLKSYCIYLDDLKQPRPPKLLASELSVAFLLAHPDVQQLHTHVQLAQRQVPISNLDKDVAILVNAFSKSVTSVANVPSSVMYPRCTWQACAYTIHAMEWLQREPGKALFGQFTSRQEEMLHSLIVSSALDLCSKSVEESLEARTFYAFNLMRTLLQTEQDTYLCILDWDPLGMLVSFTFAMPALFTKREHLSLPTCLIKELHVLHLILLAQMVILMLGMTWEHTDSPMEVDLELEEVETEGREAISVLRYLYNVTNLPQPPYSISPNQFWQTLTNDCIPFLRCCAIFYRYLSGVPPPPSLEQPGGDTFTELCTYLGLPTSCKELLEHNAVMDMVNRWGSYKNLKSGLEGKKFVRGPIKVNELVPLPKDFMDLINQVSIFRCPLTGEESRNPTICLLCGQIVCLQTYCCQVKVSTLTLGPCMAHAYTCGAGIGLFLRIRECDAFILNSPHRGCYVAPPYVDKYGETDEGLRRGYPLYLCPKSYKDLQQQWLSHSLPQMIGRHHDDLSHRNPNYPWRAF